MPLDHDKDQIVAFTMNVYMIFNVTIVTDGKLILFVRMTTKYRLGVKIDAFTKFNITLVLLNRFRLNKILRKAIISSSL